MHLHKLVNVSHFLNYSSHPNNDNIYNKCSQNIKNPYTMLSGITKYHDFVTNVTFNICPMSKYQICTMDNGIK